MKKIPFENGTKTANAYVTIDDVNHEVVDAEYEGDTPLSAENLNQMQENIEESAIAIGAIAPTTNEKIWFKHSNNIFNNNDYTEIPCNIGNDTIVSDSNCSSVYIPIEANQKYTVLRGVKGARFVIAFSDTEPKAGVSITGRIQNNTANKLVSTSSSNSKYLIVWYYHSNYDTDVSKQQILNELMIAKGEYDGQIESYADDEVFIKNRDGIYENFYKKTQYTYSFKGFTISAVKINKMVTLSISGGNTEEFEISTFYDLKLDGKLKPAIEINDTFKSSPTICGMIRIQANGILRIYPWVKMPLNSGIRYTVTYITN